MVRICFICSIVFNIVKYNMILPFVGNSGDFIHFLSEIKMQRCFEGEKCFVSKDATC